MGVVVNIYCIEDCYGEKYIGSTKNTLKKRFNKHKSDKKLNKPSGTSKLLDLNNSEIWLLEKCSGDKRLEREQYYIDIIECVNKYNAIGIKKEILHKKWRENNKLKIKQRKKEWIEKNKEHYIQHKKDYDKKKHQYQASWGGGIYDNNNSLLKISLDVFS